MYKCVMCIQVHTYLVPYAHEKKIKIFTVCILLKKLYIIDCFLNYFEPLVCSCNIYPMSYLELAI